MTNLLSCPAAMAIMLFAATLFSSNHVAARFAFDEGGLDRKAWAANCSVYCIWPLKASIEAC
ncbi:MAG: hypothetical protein K6L73_12000 [Cellvibrionaceae bacterium]